MLLIKITILKNSLNIFLVLKNINLCIIYSHNKKAINVVNNNCIANDYIVVSGFGIVLLARIITS